MALGGHSEGPGTGKAHRVGLTGPAGWSQEPPRPPYPVAPAAPSHPLQPPGLPGPASLLGLLPGQLGTPPVWYPGIPTRITHPYTHTPYLPMPVHHCMCTLPAVRGVGGTYTYGRFRRSVGEPRGLEYTLVSGSRAGLYLCIRFTRPYDWVYDRFIHCFTEFY